MNKARRLNQSGFSLVELMIVVAIIGILATIAIPNFARFQAKAKQNEAKSNLAAIYSAEKAFNSEWQSYVTDFRNIGFQPEGQLRYRVGFGAGGAAIPAGYSGPGTTTGVPGSYLSTADTNVCAATATARCTEIAGSGAAFAAVAAGATTTATTFYAEANGEIDGDATLDYWRINENKKIENMNAAGTTSTEL